MIRLLNYLISNAVELYLTQKMFGQSQNFLGSNRKIFGQQIIFGHRKPTTFSGQSFLKSEKRFWFEVKTLFKDFFGIKIEKSKTDSK